MKDLIKNVNLEKYIQYLNRKSRNNRNNFKKNLRQNCEKLKTIKIYLNVFKKNRKDIAIIF